MRHSLLVIVLPLVGAIPRGPLGERDTKTTVSKRGWLGHDVLDGNSIQPAHHSTWHWSNFHPSKWDWSNFDLCKWNWYNWLNWLGFGDEFCESDDDTQRPQQPTPTKPETPEKPPTQPSPSTTQAPPPGGGNGPEYINRVNKWMDACGLRHLAHDSTLESNAHQTSVEANGNMVHNMLPGTMAQVMARGDLTENFDRAFVGGWLCEMKTLFKDKNFCDESDLAKGWTYSGTDHAKILSNSRYTKIGCGTAKDIVICDVA
ncbi:cysteine-rich secretory protein [Metarhizium robertsii]|uniref:SCP domain-containing protein n=2 Tax=Metarhizium robertsii TaxID=568076 RepID=E9FCQ2_METRA|nr:uncharacterized protein MAA_10051 [Metarhizium robertsii ARSEF 23]EFY94508.1 hypothetical protein MAA_10051 [Metarhizium robertsii ARSEF 23]EXU95967.1 cysteine-rich secretory protein [Metarhizium robertsii]